MSVYSSSSTVACTDSDLAEEYEGLGMQLDKSEDDQQDDLNDAFGSDSSMEDDSEVYRSNAKSASRMTARQRSMVQVKRSPYKLPKSPPTTATKQSTVMTAAASLVREELAHKRRQLAHAKVERERTEIVNKLLQLKSESATGNNSGSTTVSGKRRGRPPKTALCPMGKVTAGLHHHHHHHHHHVKKEDDLMLPPANIGKDTGGEASSLPTSRHPHGQGPWVRVHSSMDGLTISFPPVDKFSMPSIFLPQHTSAERKPKLCSVVGCGRVKAYTCSKTGASLCSQMSCYKENLRTVVS